MINSKVKLATTIRRICLICFIILTASQGRTCSDYVHLWRPVIEEREQLCNAEGMALFLKELFSKKLNGQNEKRWQIGISPDTNITASFTQELKHAVSMLDSNVFSWTESASPFDADSASFATIWLDFVDPEQVTYVWRDENKPPFAMFRTGELSTARIRILAMSSQKEIILIDELSHMFLLESDFMTPTWMSTGGVWFRRLSLKTDSMEKRHEWTLSIPANEEEINTIPLDTKRYYFDGPPNPSISIISNY